MSIADGVGFKNDPPKRILLETNNREMELAKKWKWLVLKPISTLLFLYGAIALFQKSWAIGSVLLLASVLGIGTIGNNMDDNIQEEETYLIAKAMFRLTTLILCVVVILGYLSNFPILKTGIAVVVSAICVPSYSIVVVLWFSLLARRKNKSR